MGFYECPLRYNEGENTAVNSHVTRIKVKTNQGMLRPLGKQNNYTLILTVAVRCQIYFFLI